VGWWLGVWLNASSMYCISQSTLKTAMSIKIFQYCSDQIFVNQPNFEKMAHVSAKTVWGLLRGLESFSQLIYNIKEHGYQVRVVY
jgi:hypothetical protein